jgi:peptidoglycan/LPS O-acetylase OafA/YrhL
MINGAMWTIEKEFSCYLLVLLAGVIGILNKRYLVLASTVILFAVLAFFKLNHIAPVNLRLPSFFLSGVCYYLYRDRIVYKGTTAAILTLAVIFFMQSWRGCELAIASLGGYPLLYVASKRSAFLSHFNRLPDVSYGVYLYGWPVQKMWLWYQPSLSPIALFFVTAPIAVLLGMASWYLVEKPALRFKGPQFQMQEASAQTHS